MIFRTTFLGGHAYCPMHITVLLRTHRYTTHCYLHKILKIKKYINSHRLNHFAFHYVSMPQLIQNSDCGGAGGLRVFHCRINEVL
jgi:hypothetical protein